MRKRLEIALMLTTAIATSISLAPPAAWAANGWPAEGDERATSVSSSSSVRSRITTTEENGRTIYVNDDAPAPVRQAQAAQPARPRLVYWSSKENRWKPVPSAGTASMRAARSAAAEVTQYFGHDSTQAANAKIISANALGHQASQEEIDSAIVMSAARHNVDPNLVRAVVKVESNFNSNAISRKGAMGLMQLMPSTARELKVKNPFDPEQNVDAGVRHLKQLLENYDGDVNLTLAAYNAGSGAVARSAGVPRYAETQNYVRRITNLYYGGFDIGSSGASHDPVKVQRDARGVLYISNTE
ncbi:MAG TPA: lytic transglycosylase domain-containing protein [Terriglobales bacterium]|nr:lytic transglycosylase domain-containing protein [Terriglobales bacterium]